MKKIYWRQAKINRRTHSILAILAILVLVAVEFLKVEIRQPRYRQKIKAARLMRSSMEILSDYRIKKIGPIDETVDPLKTGLIGYLQSPISSNLGSIQSKRTTLNPNWAAVMVELFRKAKLEKGDVVAMGFSGSFPALNIAAVCAAEVMELDYVVISSVASSTWGANVPKFTWLDMEKILYEHRIISKRSIAASLGGIGDKAIGISKHGKELLLQSIEASNISIIKTKFPQENLDMRMQIYQGYAGEKPIRAYVNIGGGTISVGTRIGKKFFKPGLNLRPPAHAIEIEGILSRFSQDGVPVIHMTQIVKLANKYGLPEEPTLMPAVGNGKIFKRKEYNMIIVWAGVLLILITAYLLIRRNMGYRLFLPKRSATNSPPPEKMV